jgi:hypothetical protein
VKIYKDFMNYYQNFDQQFKEVKKELKEKHKMPNKKFQMYFNFNWILVADVYSHLSKLRGDKVAIIF